MAGDIVGLSEPAPAAAGCCSGQPQTAQTPSVKWLRAAGRARLLAWGSLIWMTAEGALGLLAGVDARSVALVGWAIGSVIEGLASIAVIWRLSGTRQLSETAERRAQKAVAVSFYLLGPYIVVEAVRNLIDSRATATGALGIAVTASSLVVMPWLGRAKQSLGRQLDSAATAAEGVQTLLCAAQAGAVLLGLCATAALGWTWIDPSVALVLAMWTVREGREAWRGEGCC